MADQSNNAQASLLINDEFNPRGSETSSGSSWGAQKPSAQSGRFYSEEEIEAIRRGSRDQAVVQQISPQQTQRVNMPPQEVPQQAPIYTAPVQQFQPQPQPRQVDMSYSQGPVALTGSQPINAGGENAYAPLSSHDGPMSHMPQPGSRLRRYPGFFDHPWIPYLLLGLGFAFVITWWVGSAFVISKQRRARTGGIICLVMTILSTIFWISYLILYIVVVHKVHEAEHSLSSLVSALSAAASSASTDIGSMASSAITTALTSASAGGWGITLSGSQNWTSVSSSSAAAASGQSAVTAGTGSTFYHPTATTEEFTSSSGYQDSSTDSDSTGNNGASTDVICKSTPPPPHGEDVLLVLACPYSNQFITSISFASYGTPQGGCDDPTTGYCDSPSSNQVVRYACIGYNRCAINATNSVFGDPCYATYKWLTVEAICSS